MGSQKPFDPSYGMDKVKPPYFFEVALNVPMQVVASRLRLYGRIFPRDLEVVQVAHVLKKRDRFFICHFKSLLYLDGVASKESLQDKDFGELAGAMYHLESNGLVEFMDKPTHPVLPDRVGTVWGDTRPWNLVSKYTFKKPH